MSPRPSEDHTLGVHAEVYQIGIGVWEYKVWAPNHQPVQRAINGPFPRFFARREARALVRATRAKIALEHQRAAGIGVERIE